MQFPSVKASSLEALLSTTYSSQPEILSIFLEQNKHRTNSTLNTTISSILEQVRKEAPKGIHSLLTKDKVENIKQKLVNTEYPPNDVVIFLNLAGEIYASFSLHQRLVESKAYIGRYPIVAPLFAEQGNISLLITNHSKAVFYTGKINGLQAKWEIETEDNSDIEYGRRDRTPRRTDKHRLREHVLTIKDKLLQERPERLFIAVPSFMKTELCDKLHPYTKQELVSLIEGDYLGWSLDKLSEVINPVIEQSQKEYEQDLLKQLVEQQKGELLEKDELLQALWEGRVSHLVYGIDQTLDGYYCPECGYLHQNQGICPLCSEELNHSNNLLERMVQQACRTGVQISSLQTFHQHNIVGSERFAFE